MGLSLILKVKNEYILATTDAEGQSMDQLLMQVPLHGHTPDKITLTVIADYPVDEAKYRGWFNFLNASTASYSDYLEQLLLVHTVISFENKSNCKPELRVMDSYNREIELNIWNAWKSMRKLKDLEYQTVSDLFTEGIV